LLEFTFVTNTHMRSGGEGANRRDRILIVDDEQDTRELIGQVLAEAGYAVEVAGDGFEAIEKLPRALPDLVVTDLRMPGMHGVDLAQRIRSQSDVPVVFTTGMESFDLCTDAAAYGAVACLTKPINLEELLWTIDCALACRRDENGLRPAFSF
jgi:two-component system, response regulator PdtaR